MISERNLKKICAYIVDNFVGVKIELDKYLIEHTNEILQCSGAKIKYDEFLDLLCDNTNNDYQNLAKTLQKTIAEYGISSKVNICFSAPFYFIENTTFGANAHSGNRQLYIKKLEEKCEVSAKNEKGGFFEEFCTLFLKDIGATVQTTSKTGDGGIDIIGRIKINLPVFLGQILGREVVILAQVKFHQQKVDTPIIRRIIGDSLFYRFNVINEKMWIGALPLYLVIFSHKGFTDKALHFSNKYGVITLDSNRIIDLLCNLKEPECLKSIMYLLAE